MHRFLFTYLSLSLLLMLLMGCSRLEARGPDAIDMESSPEPPATTTTQVAQALPSSTTAVTAAASAPVPPPPSATPLPPTEAPAPAEGSPPTEVPPPPTEVLPLPTEVPPPPPTEIPPPPEAPVPAEVRESAPVDVPVLGSGAEAPAPEPEQAAVSAVSGAPVAMSIASIGLEQPLIAVGLDGNNVPIVPRHDVGWYTYSAQPGQGENVVLWGHVLRFQDAPNIPAPFARLQDLPIGANITLYAEDGAAHTYAVREHVWVTPDQVQYILPQGTERLTLVSCIGDKVLVEGSVEMTHRLITIADPV